MTPEHKRLSDAFSLLAGHVVGTLVVATGAPPTDPALNDSLNSIAKLLRSMPVLKEYRAWEGMEKVLYDEKGEWRGKRPPGEGRYK